MKDAIAEYDTKVDTQNEEDAKELNEARAKLYEYGKEMVEYNVKLLDDEIDKFERLISKQKSLLSLYENIDAKILRDQYGVDVDENANRYDLMESQYNGAIASSTNKLATHRQQRSMYEQMIAAANTKKEDSTTDWDKVFADFESSDAYTQATDETKATYQRIKEVISRE